MSDSDGLTREQVQQYHEQGFVGPFDLCSKSKAKEYRLDIYEELQEAGVHGLDIDGTHPLQLRHLDSETVRELCTKDEIVAKMTDVLGDDLLLWDSRLFYKDPGGGEIPWHQHYHHMAVEPKVSITAWIALSDCTQENGCLEFVPGSNEFPYPQVESPDDVWDPKMTDPEYVDEDEAVAMEMEAGQYVLFAETTLHMSSENTSEIPRRALAARAVPSFVNVMPEETESNPYVEDYPTVLLSGEDEYELNNVVSLSES